MRQTDSRQVDQPGYGSSRPPDTRAGGEDRMRQFVSVVLADTEDVWRQTFRDMGRNYERPKARALFRRGAIAVRHGFFCLRAVLLSERPEGLSRPGLLRGDEEPDSMPPASSPRPTSSRMRSGITCRTNSASSRRPTLRGPAATSEPRTRSRCASSCRPTASPASGPTTPTAPSTSSNRAMSRRR